MAFVRRILIETAITRVHLKANGASTQTCFAESWETCNNHCKVFGGMTLVLAISLKHVMPAGTH